MIYRKNRRNGQLGTRVYDAWDEKLKFILAVWRPIRVRSIFDHAKVIQFIRLIPM